MARTDLLVQALSDFARTLVRRFDVADVLFDLTTRVVAVLEVDSAGVFLSQDNGRLAFVTAHGEAASHLERFQEEHQAGPCVDAFTTREPVRVGDLGRAPGAWQGFAARARELRFTAVAAIPMRLDEHCIGALDLYCAGPRQWSDHDVRVAGVFADMATSYVVTASELQRHQQIAEQLRQALQSRIIIEQAKGIIAAERQVTVDQAFELLRAHARSHSADLRSTAEAVVKLGLRP
jgi:GAF domain-containing protein